MNNFLLFYFEFLFYYEFTEHIDYTFWNFFFIKYRFQENNGNQCLKFQCISIL